MDTRTYDSVNFDDPISTLSYYKKIFHIIAQLSDEDIDDHFELMTYLFKLRTAEKGSKLFAEAQAHQIMRSAAERVHVYFREIVYPSQKPYGDLVLGVVFEAHLSLLKLMRDCVIEEYKHLQTLSSWFAIMIGKLLASEVFRKGASAYYMSIILTGPDR